MNHEDPEPDIPKAQSQQSYQQFSSQEILVQFGQPQTDLIGAVLTSSNKIFGRFGIAEISQNKQDKLILFNTNTRSLTLSSKIYRAIIVRSNKKKDAKTNTQINKDVNGEKEKDSEQNMFESSESQVNQQPKKRQKRELSKHPTRTRIIRKLKALSKKKS